jgi:hypothetical protein
MNPWRWVDPRIGQVRLENVKTYLTNHGWLQMPNPNPNFLRFEHGADSNGAIVFQMVPASDSFGDFRQSITYLLTTLSEIEERHPVEVLEDVLSPARDQGGNDRLRQPAQSR